jgi:hypothetical protein
MTFWSVPLRATGSSRTAPWIKTLAGVAGFPVLRMANRVRTVKRRGTGRFTA